MAQGAGRINQTQGQKARMRSVLIFNPKAGTAHRIKDFLLHLTAGARCELRPTSQPEDARRIAREVVQEGFDRLIVAGGDGTIGQAVQGIAPDFDRIELAVLPFGTGNDLARSLGFSPDQMELAYEAAFAERTEPIDLIKITDNDEVQYCINVANGGFGGRVAMDIQTVDKRRWGPMAYWITSASRLVDLQQYQVRMDVDGTEREFQALGVAIANGRFVGGGFPIAPKALLNDGWMDITVIPVLPTFELLAAGLNFTLNPDASTSRITTLRARQLRLHATPELPFSIDGEPIRHLSATCEVLPKCLRVVVAEDAPGLCSDSHSEDWLD
ncbi:MAG: diacylglycerol kinase family lipid kinase [Planctomycetota bacterium]|nr:MAG: diacylglycerol kinase family lipid kinase [Planctomycetota bacterium]